MALPVENEKELVVSGFQGIKKVRGLLVSIDVVDPPESWERNSDRQVVKVDLVETVVLEMFGDEEAMELKDGKFGFYIPYVESGKKPHQNSIYSRCWLASAKELGSLPSQFIGQFVTLEKQPRLLFQQYSMEDDGTGKKILKLDENGDKVKVDVLAVNQAGLPNHFCFVADETANSNSIQEYIRDLVVGLNQKAAQRALLLDQKAKQFPEYKERLNAGTLAKYLGLRIVEDKFVLMFPPLRSEGV